MLGALIGAHQLCLRLVIAAVGLVLDSLANCTNSSRSGVSEVAFNPFDAFYPVLNSFERRGSTVGYALRKGRNPGKASGTPPFFQRLKDHNGAAFAV